MAAADISASLVGHHPVKYSFQGIIDWLHGVLSAIAGFFTHIWKWLMKHIIRHLIAVLTAAYEILNNIVSQITRLLKIIRSWYFKHIFPIQHAILEVISRIRVALALLRLLGVKWAAKLDAELQKIQGYITQSIQDVIGTLNTMQSYLSLVVDPGMILRKDFFAASMFSSLGAMKRATGFGINTPLPAADEQRVLDNKALLDPAQPFARTDASGRLQTTPAFDEIQGDFANAVRDVGLPN
jgi:hypothetical protein